MPNFRECTFRTAKAIRWPKYGSLANAVSRGPAIEPLESLPSRISAYTGFSQMISQAGWSAQRLRFEPGYYALHVPRAKQVKHVADGHLGEVVVLGGEANELDVTPREAAARMVGTGGSGRVGSISPPTACPTPS